MANEHFASRAAVNGFAFVPIGTVEEYRQEFENAEIWQSLAGVKTLGRWICRSMPAQYQAVVEHHEEGNTVVVCSGAAFGARIAHDALGLPLATIMLQPALIRSAHRPPIVAGAPPVLRWLPPFVIRGLFFRPFDAFADHVLRVGEVNAFRTEVGLAPVKRLAADWWLSPQRVIALFPSWYAEPQPDWPKQLRMTGFPLYDQLTDAAAMPDDAQQFLAGGTPPIVFTPGTGMMHGRAFFEAAVEACRLLGRRGMLLTRHTDHLPPSLPPSVGHFTYVPFSQLLQRAAAIVHHGGMGTLAQAIAAGIPQLVMPMAYDQPDNASRLKRLGIGDSLRPRAFRGPAVARKLQRLLDAPQTAERCATLARKMDGPGAIQQTCELIEELVG
jgi:UDP:flavonoid glycosyltransferase YjiC (YdhE family)